MEAKNIFDEFILKDSFVGVHGITGKRSYDHELSIEEIANNILDKGLFVTDWGGLLSNIVLLGKLKDFTFFEAQSYSYPSKLSSDSYNIVISIPETITSREGETYFLGNLPRTIDDFNPGDRGFDSELSNIVKFNPINRYVIDNKLMPSELIAGYIVNINNQTSFVQNKNYIGVSKENEEKFIDKLNPSKYNLINIKEDISSVEEKLNRAIDMEKSLNISGYSSYFKEAINFLKENNKSLGC